MNPLGKKKSTKTNKDKNEAGGKKLKPAAKDIKQHVDQSGYMSILSHEIRTPLATICSSAELIQMINSKNKPKDVSDPGIKEHAVKIRNSAHRIIELLDNVIAVNRIESDKLAYSQEKIDVAAFINDIINKVKMNFAVVPEIRLEFKLEEDSCMADKKLLDLIFSNLISNAVKFSNGKGKININVALLNSVIQFSIADNGIGIPDADRPNLFEPFFRGKNAVSIPGEGLGMYIVKKAVELNDGKISFRSKLNTGTTFIIQIPVNKDKKNPKSAE